MATSDLISRVIAAESSGNPNAVSPKGAVGLMQLMPGTAAMLGVDPTDPAQNVAGGTRYLAELQRRFGQRGGLIAYNEGPTKYARGTVLPQSAAYADKVLGMPAPAIDPSSAFGQMLAKSVPNADTDPDFKAARDAQAKASAASAQAGQQFDASGKVIGQISDHLAQLDTTAMPEVHKLELPEENQPQRRDPTTALGQFLPLLAVFGGAVSKKYSVAALQAAAGAMNGVKENDQKAIDDNHQKWLDSMKRLEEMHSAEQEAFDRGIKLKDSNREGLMSQLSLVAALDNNILMKQHLTQGDVDGAVKIWESKNAAGKQVFEILKLAQGQQKLTDGEQDASWKHAHADETKNPVNAAFSDAKAAYLKDHPNDEAGAEKAATEAASRVSSGIHTPRSPIALAMQKFTQEHPNATDEDVAGEYARIQGQTKATRDFGTGKQGQAVNSFNVALAHLDTLGGLAEALGNGDQQSINRLHNSLKQEFGAEAPANFEAAKRIVGDEVTKAIVGSGGALGDREETAKVIAAAKSPKQLAGVIDTYKKLMVGQLTGLQQQYEQTTGQKDFDKRLSPEAKRMMAAHGGGDGTKHKVGDIIEHGGKRYRVTGGDPSDPDVELVK